MLLKINISWFKSFRTTVVNNFIRVEMCKKAVHTKYNLQLYKLSRTNNSKCNES